MNSRRNEMWMFAGKIWFFNSLTLFYRPRTPSRTRCPSYVIPIYTIQPIILHKIRIFENENFPDRSSKPRRVVRERATSPSSHKKNHPDSFILLTVTIKNCKSIKNNYKKFNNKKKIANSRKTKIVDARSRESFPQFANPVLPTEAPQRTWPPADTILVRDRINYSLPYRALPHSSRSR